MLYGIHEFSSNCSQWLKVKTIHYPTQLVNNATTTNVTNFVIK